MFTMISRLSSWLLISLPFLIISGPFLPDLIMSFLAIYALFLSRKPELRFYYKHLVTKLMLEEKNQVQTEEEALGAEQEEEEEEEDGAAAAVSFDAAKKKKERRISLRRRDLPF